VPGVRQNFYLEDTMLGMKKVLFEICIVDGLFVVSIPVCNAEAAKGIGTRLMVVKSFRAKAGAPPTTSFGNIAKIIQ